MIVRAVPELIFASLPAVVEILISSVLIVTSWLVAVIDASSASERSVDPLMTIVAAPLSMLAFVPSETVPLTARSIAPPEELTLAFAPSDALRPTLRSIIPPVETTSTSVPIDRSRVTLATICPEPAFCTSFAEPLSVIIRSLPAISVTSPVAAAFDRATRSLIVRSSSLPPSSVDVSTMLTAPAPELMTASSVVSDWLAVISMLLPVADTPVVPLSTFPTVKSPVLVMKTPPVPAAAST